MCVRFPHSVLITGITFLVSGQISNAAKNPRGNCDMKITFSPGAPSDKYSPLYSPSSHPVDLEDELFGVDGAEDYQRFKEQCQHGDKSQCRMFSVEADSLDIVSSSALHAAHEGNSGKRPDSDDTTGLVALSRFGNSPKCGGGITCEVIEGKVRVVGLTLNEFKLQTVEALGHLKYLKALSLQGAKDTDDISSAKLPESLRAVWLTQISQKQGTRIAPLLRAQGRITRVGLYGPQHVKHWIKWDLSLFCGLDLQSFNGFVLNLGDIPDCWSKMTNLRQFYCTNCMITTPPVALKGNQALRSFVAFRQSEMIPCAVKDVSQSLENCKPSWETRHVMKEKHTKESTGHYGDFQEGPSFLCPEFAYAFPFKDIVDLGWTNIEKVWLDGNFLTGPIPDDIADVWPSLQSLDLYDNSMDGPIPSSLARLDFVKLQLQSNNFSGTVPREVAAMLAERQIVFGISENLELSGCLPTRGSKRGLADTALTPCDKNEL